MNNSSLIKHICFDLDGTIINSYSTIYKTTIKTLEHFKITDPLEEKEFLKRIGHHFLHIFRDLNINVPDIEHFINVYKSFYFDFIDDSTIYAGAENVFNYLKEKEIKISLLTTKAQDQAEKILEHFNLTHFFSAIMGRRTGIEIKPSPAPLLLICKELGVDPAETIMTGDSELDIQCGKNAGAKSCAVTYGYRTLEVLQDEKPDFVISDIKEIIKILKP
ncbi:MAG: HAD-IA family hydrolase [Ignavibacteriaceae bacterium]